MVGENFEIYTSEMAKNTFKIVHHGWRKFWDLHFWNGEKYTLNPPSCMIRESFEIYTSEMAKNTL